MSSKRTLINFSNHPSALWSAEQLAAAHVYGEVFDLPFPHVNPHSNADDLSLLADEYVQKILSFSENSNITVHVMGEMTLSYLVVTRLRSHGIECIASTTEREVEDFQDGRKLVHFRFVQFRKF